MTGYTAQLVENNLDFNGFVWACARAFGALVEMRDEPTGAEIPSEIEVDDYYYDSLRRAEEELDRWEGMNQAEREAWADESIAETLKGRIEYQAAQRHRVEVMQNMLIKVERWVPPSPDHDNLKDFMLQQLRDSIKWDRFDKEFEDRLNHYKSKEYRDELLNDRRQVLLESVDGAKTRLKEAVDKAAEKNTWLRLLRDAIGLPPGKVK